MVRLSTRCVQAIAVLSCGAGALGQSLAPPSVPASDEASTAGSNWLLNGDFEAYAGGLCDNDLANDTFTMLMSDAVAFGLAEEIDVLTSDPTCPESGTINGVRKVCIRRQADGDADAFSLAMATPLVTGNVYTVQFFAYAGSSASSTNGRVQIGLSNSATDFGVVVYEGDMFTTHYYGNWNLFAASFVAPISASYLTVGETRVDAWTHMDAFFLAQPTLGEEYCVSTENKLGFPADIEASGSASSSAGDLTLSAAHVTNQPGIFFHGIGPGLIPYSCGFLCAIGNIVRGEIISGSGGFAIYTYDNSSAKRRLTPHIGSTRYFQYWYRDPHGPCNLSNNLSTAIAIAILP